MPRSARIDFPGAVHHIMIRGIEKKPIFKDKSDFGAFLARLGEVLTQTGTACYAWAQMDNHVHLLLRAGSQPISTAMRRLLTGYAQSFNRRHGRHGHLFQNRYKSILCDEDAYLLELVRYIHLNLIRARIVKSMEELTTSPRSGHAAIMGQTRCAWMDHAYVLSMFGPTVTGARRAYQDFVSQGIAHGRRDDLVGGGIIRSSGGWSTLRDAKASGLRIVSDERILGSSDFAHRVLKQNNESYNKRTSAEFAGWDLSSASRLTAEHFAVRQEAIRSAVKNKNVSRARAVLCHLGIDLLGMTGAGMARHLGVTPSAVSKLAVKGRSDPASKDIQSRFFHNRDP